MARILVAGPRNLAADGVGRLLERLRRDGHDAEATGTDLEAVHDADAVVVFLDDADGPTAAAIGAAHAWGKPVLGLALQGTTPPLAGACTQLGHGASMEEALRALPEFYDRVRPFAGRLVRDLVPRLVREAGYDVTFRAVDRGDRPRFLKQKILDEARQLLAADAGAEKEEVADVLEALEALIQTREYGRDGLKQIKEAKHKRRGGFERGWVVESTSRPAAGASPASTSGDPTSAEERDAADEGWNAADESRDGRDHGVRTPGPSAEEPPHRGDASWQDRKSAPDGRGEDRPDGAAGREEERDRGGRDDEEEPPRTTFFEI